MNCTRSLRVLVAQAALALVVAASPAMAQTAIDGSRFRMGDATWRLFGMEAPDPEQLCRHKWPAGVQATRALDALLQGGEVICEEMERNQDGERVGLCESAGQDIAAAMVRSGMGWADLPASRKYVVEEARAASDHIGVHGHACTSVWNWRIKNRLDPQFVRREGSGGRAD